MEYIGFQAWDCATGQGLASKPQIPGCTPHHECQQSATATTGWRGGPRTVFSPNPSSWSCTKEALHGHAVVSPRLRYPSARSRHVDTACCCTCVLTMVAGCLNVGYKEVNSAAQESVNPAVSAAQHTLNQPCLCGFHARARRFRQLLPCGSNRSNRLSG